MLSCVSDHVNRASHAAQTIQYLLSNYEPVAGRFHYCATLQRQRKGHSGNVGALSFHVCKFSISCRDLKLDDLLEKQRENVAILDLEYTTLSVNKLMALLNKTVRRSSFVA